MNKKIDLLARIQSARERLRDVAAASLAEAERQRLDQVNTHTEAKRALDTVIAEASDQLRGADRVTDLEIVAAHVGGAEQDVITANTSVDVAKDASRKASEQLRVKEQELRVVEKLAENLKAERNQALDRAEQLQSDDLTASRWRRSG